MKSLFYKFLSRFIILWFLFYWVLSIALSVSASTDNGKLAHFFPGFNRLFGHSWNLFVQSFNYDDRIYLVLRNKKTKVVTDSLELLGDIEYQKKLHAPFNQHEYIIDRLVDHNATVLKRKTVEYSKSIRNRFSGITDSVYQIKLSGMEKQDQGFIECLGTLDNYCKTILAEKNISTTGKEYKIIIKERAIKPFDQRKNNNYVLKQVVYFESSYNSFSK